VQVSRTPLEPFEQRGTLPCVGEALKREIAGLVLADRRFLWGFEGGRWLASGRVGRVRGVCSGNRIMSFVSFLPICTSAHQCHRRLPLQYLDYGHAVRAASCVACSFGYNSNLWRVFHAAALAVVGGALGCCAGVMVSMMISRPPQHGQGSARTRGSSSVSPRLSSLAFS